MKRKLVYVWVNGSIADVFSSVAEAERVYSKSGTSYTLEVIEYDAE